MKETAVEFLMDKLFDPNFDREKQINWFNQAKEMEKQQIIDATLYGFREDAESFDWKGDNFNAEQYYNEKFIWDL